MTLDRRFGRRLARMVRLQLGLTLVCVAAMHSEASAQTPAFVQRNFATPQSQVAVASVAFTGAQTTGNLNVVFVGWSGGPAQVQSVTDSRGNSYVNAVGPTTSTDGFG